MFDAIIYDAEYGFSHLLLEECDYCIDWSDGASIIWLDWEPINQTRAF